MTSPADPALVARARQIIERESAAFAARTPASAEWLAQARTRMPDGVPMAWMVALQRHPPVVAVRGSGSRFWDLDDNAYIDFNLADQSMAAGYCSPPIVAAIKRQAELGNQFLLPTADAIDVCRLLTERFDLPKWQFTISASGANTDALRLARVATGRSTVLIFDGKYHGHVDQIFWSSRAGDSGAGGGPLEADGLGLDPESGRHVEVLSYNDADALRGRLGKGDVAAVMLEPALTNCGLVLPLPDFVAVLNKEVRAAGAVLIVDETHTQFAVFGGGTRHFGFQPDIVTGGKGIAGGIPIGTVGMTDDLADVMSQHVAYWPGREETGDCHGIATGGTLYANAMSLAAALAGLTEVFTEDAADRVNELGGRLQRGLQAQVDRVGLPWTIDRLGGRAQWRLTPVPPTTGADGFESVVLPIDDARKLFLANRGVWDAISAAGPAVSFAASAEDADAYISAAGDYLDELTE
ncbi:MAG TPA: aminotransferase class III-fold pyridoxal phosphate-dependent enzyme [Streptosporangiaceae bacterium]|jgi:glutamate-1-semialdehyde 2,1-aminomutase|nr:aminotransferase class III-fold pyridoxal phosphate-dependent enzyme [Streptosporangiaceae bacterium]